MASDSSMKAALFYMSSATTSPLPDVPGGEQARRVLHAQIQFAVADALAGIDRGAALRRAFGPVANRGMDLQSWRRTNRLPTDEDLHDGHGVAAVPADEGGALGALVSAEVAAVLTRR